MSALAQEHRHPTLSSRAPQPTGLPSCPPNKGHSQSTCDVQESTLMSATAHTQPLIDLLKSCEESGSLKKENCIHRHVLKSDFSDRDLLVLSNHQVHVYFKCNYYEAARRVFDEMPQRNVFSWTVMIVASKEHGYYRDGVELFCMTLDQGVLPNGFAFSAVLQSCVGLVSVELGEMVHTHVVVTVEGEDRSRVGG
ncbi:hypothetical protein JHK86_007069 [Glycine max]|nr:hypothetical protein JHK86_007069 [Glycine max]